MSCPYPLDSRHGNAVSARRLMGVIQEAGFEVSGQQGWDGEEADVLVAQHAVRSAEAVMRFRERCPHGLIVVVLTGTDLYRDLLVPDSEGYEVLEIADCLVVAQEASLASVPERFWDKAVVIRKSVQLPDSLKPDSLGRTEVRAPRGVTVVGHLRGIKDPFLAVEALQEAEDLELRLEQIGSEREEGYAEMARGWERRERRYCYLGELSREETLRKVSESGVMVNSSLMEGGSNAVLEAMALGVPVLATRIEGNVGLLGEDYGGFFEAGDQSAFLALVERFLSKEEFRKRLMVQMKERMPLFSKEQEVQGWGELLRTLAATQSW